MGPLNDNTGDLPSHPQGQGYYEEASYPSGLTLAPSAPGASSSPDDDGNETGGMRTTTASINNPMLEALTTAAALAAAANDRPGDNELSSSQDNSQATGLQSLAANSSSSDMQPTLSTLRETPKVYKNNPLLLAPATSIPQNHPLAAAHENISMYPFHEQNSPVPPMFLNQKLRHGKWSTEEEDYANALIEIFQSGHAIVNEKNGKTLRAFLSRKLHCSPMRVSKKFKGTKVGKLIFTSKPGSILAMSPIMLERCLARLAETEVKFYKKIFSNYTGQFILANGSPAGAGPALPRPPNASNDTVAPNNQVQATLAVAPIATQAPTMFPTWGPYPPHPATTNTNPPMPPQAAFPLQPPPPLSTAAHRLNMVTNATIGSQPSLAAIPYSLPPITFPSHPKGDDKQNTGSLFSMNPAPLSLEEKNAATLAPVMWDAEQQLAASSAEKKRSSTNFHSYTKSLHEAYIQSVGQAPDVPSGETNDTALTFNEEPSNAQESSASIPTNHEVPDFLAGFDKAASGTAFGLTNQKSNTGNIISQDLGNEFSPTYTSKSFDDFHKLLGKNISPLSKSKRDCFELNPGHEMPSIPVLPFQSASFPSIDGQCTQDANINRCHPSSASHDSSASQKTPLLSKSILAMHNRPFNTLKDSSSTGHITTNTGFDQRPRFTVGHSTLVGSQTLVAHNQLTNQLPIHDILWSSDHQEGTNLSIDASKAGAHPSTMDAGQHSGPLLMEHLADGNDDVQQGMMSLGSQIQFSNVANGSWNRHMEYQDRMSRLQSHPLNSPKAVSVPSHASSEVGTEDDGNSTTMYGLSNYDTSSNTATDSNSNDSDGSSGGPSRKKRPSRHSKESSVETNFNL